MSKVHTTIHPFARPAFRKAILLHLLAIFAGWTCAGGEPFFLEPAGIRATVETNKISRDLLDEYLVRAWGSTDGMPQNHVDKVVRDRQGYLWLSTWVGLCRFNGRAFVTFDPVNTPELKSETISDMLVDEEGEVWVSTKNGLYRVSGTSFEYHGLEQGLPSNDILSMELDEHGTKWLTTARGLARMEGTNVTTYVTGLENPVVQNIHFNGDGTAIVFTYSGPLLFDPKSGRFSALPDRLVANGNPQRREVIGPDREGMIWFRTIDAIYRLAPDGTSERMREVPEKMKSERMLLLCDTRGDIWLAGNRAGVLQRYSRGQLSEMDLGAAHQITSFNAMVEEPTRNLFWLCTGQGLLRLKERAVRSYGRRQGMLHDYVFALADLGNGRALLGTRRWPAIIDLEKMECRVFLLPGVSATSRSLIPNADGSFWVTDGNIGPTHINPDGAVSRSSLTKTWPGPAEQYVFYRDSKNRLWIGSEAGLHIVDGDRVTHLDGTTKPAIPGTDVRVVREMTNHTIWLGGNRGGITVLSPDAGSVMEHYSTTNGLSHDDVWAMEVDDEGDVWAATVDGLDRIHQGQVGRLTTDDGLLENVINQILKDNYGYLWLTGMQGIYRVDPKQLSNYLDGRTEEFDVLPVNTDDGLINAETNGEQQPAGFVDQRGRLWIPTIAGVAIVDPGRFRTLNKPARPNLERIVMDGEVVYDKGPGPKETVSLAERFGFPAGHGRLLELQFAAPEAGLSEAVTYQIRLNGHDDGWRSVGRQMSAIYTNLRPGDYSFDLRVVNHHRQASSRSTEFRFHLAAFPYQTAWFWILVVASAIALGYAIHRRRLAIASHIQNLEQRNALVSERERIARDMHDDLGSRLTHISLLADLTRRSGRDQGAGKLDELNLAARDAARAVEEIVWSANPGNDTLASLMNYMIQHAENILGAASIACRVDAAIEWPHHYLSPERRHSTFMAFKEAINNLIKHSHASEVRLSLHPVGNEAHIRITDNGAGFDRNAARQDEEDGLDNMAARMKKIGGTCRIESTPGSGTAVELIFSWEVAN